MSLEQEFKAWLKRQINSKGGEYKANTIQDYSQALKHRASKLNDVQLQHTNLFEYKSSASLTKAITDIKNAPNLKEVEQQAGNGAFSRGMALYLEFLKEKENRKADFIWVKTFNAITTWLKSYRNRQNELIDMLNQVGLRTDKADRGMIDPFTFIGLFVQNKKRYIEYLNKFIAQEKIDAPLMVGNDGMPTIMPFNPYYYRSDGFEETINNLWNLFEEAGDITKSSFEKALDVQGIGWPKLTQGMFRAYPDLYLPIDRHTEKWLRNNNHTVPKSYEEYIALMKELRTGNKKMYEISHEAFIGIQILNAGVSMHPLNQILYGPPGTGKTYDTMRRAVEIIDGEAPYERDELKKRYEEYVDSQQITMVTFHQSYSYEDFVEGIKADTDKNGRLIYEYQNGVFKNICARAKDKGAESITGNYDLADKTIWKMSLGDSTKQVDDQIYSDCIEKEYIALGWGGWFDYTGCQSRNDLIQKNKELAGKPLTYVDSFVNEMKKGDIVVISKGNWYFRAVGEIIGDYEFDEDENIIGREYLHCRKVKWLKVFDPQSSDKIFKKQIIQQTLYNAKDSIDKEKLSKFLATEIIDKPYVLIIDEINRGNISRIFGELITLIEESKRKGKDDERSVILPYSKKPFFVPDNLYIIGTMNTADRSLTSIDLALRRRFHFVEIPPQYDKLDIMVHGVNIGEMLEAINNRIEALIDKEHCIGHCYFLSLEESDDPETELARIFTDKVMPLLQEYFYGDWDSIRKVLNKQIVEPATVKVDNDNLPIFRINTEAYNKPETYLEIAKP